LALGSDNSNEAAYFPVMCFSEVLAELPLLTFPRRQSLVRRAVESDDPGLAPANEVEAEKRLGSWLAK